MRDVFLSVRSDAPEVVVRGRLLKGAAAIIALTALLALPLTLTNTVANLPFPMPALVFDLVVCSLSFWLAHRGAVTFGGIIFCLALVVVNVLSSWTGAGNDILISLTSYIQLFPIMVAGMVIGSRAIPFFGALPLVAFTLASSRGQSSQLLLGSTFTVIAVAALFWLIMRTLEYLISQAREQTRAARAAQHELEIQRQTLQNTNQDLISANEQMSSLLRLVRDLERPLIPLMDGVLVLPLVGHLDARRAAQVTATTLRAVHERRSQTLIVDLTGVSFVDTTFVEWLTELSNAVRLLGVATMIAGVSAEIAQAVVAQGVGLGEIRSVGRLQEGIKLVGGGTA